MKEESFCLLALSLVPGIGCATIHRLLGSLGSAAEVFRRTRAELRSEGLTKDMQCYVLAGWAKKDAEKAVDEARRRDSRIITLADPEYPPQLREIYDPPVVLYIAGEVKVLSDSAVAIVGSRKCSVYGQEVTGLTARHLSRSGLVVVSGLARGIDTCAHRGALEVGGSTIAVFGTGLDTVYPRENRKLARQIRERGCLLTEFPFYTPPSPQNFPVRNRIISGLTLGTVIAEAGEFSGSLITARMALEQGREVWAVPGNITQPGSYGPNHLIKQGAKPILNHHDVLEDLPLEVLDRLEKLAEEVTEKDPGLKDRKERQVLEALSVQEAIHFDHLLTKTKIPLPELTSILVSLVGRGLIREYPGRRFIRKLRG